MPIVRPNADIQADWDESPTGSAFDRLNDAVTQPTNPGTTDRITTAVAGATCIVGLESLATPLSNGDTVDGGTLWVNGEAVGASSPFTATVEKADGTDLAVITFAESQRWKSAAFSQVLTEAEVDALQIRLVATDIGVGNRHAFAAYVDLSVKAGRRTRSMMGVGA